MTRTKKTGLLVTLLVVLMALVAAAFTVPGIAKADVSLSANAKLFVDYMAPYEYLDLLTQDAEYTEALYKDYEGDPAQQGAGKFNAKDLWLSYSAAKSLVAGNLLTQKDTEALKKHNDGKEYTRYEKMDAKFAKVYNLSLEYNSFLSQIVSTTTDYAADYGDWAILDKWQAGTYTDHEMATDTELKMFMAIVDNDTKAREYLAARKALLDNIKTAISEIEYYVSGTSGAANSVMQKGVTSGEIVLGSADSIQAVKTAIGSLDITDGDKTYIATYAQYEKANDDYNALVKRYQDVEAAIKAVLDKVVLTPGSEVYYTLKDAAEVADRQYKTLEAESKKYMGNSENPAEADKCFNDLASKVTNYKKVGAGDAYNANLESLNAAIAKVGEAIGAIQSQITTFSGKTQEYNTAKGEYVDLVDEAEKAYKALPWDVRDHDEKLYAGTKTGYYITDYAKYVAATEYVAARRAEITAIEAEIDKLMKDFEAADTPEKINEVNGKVIALDTRIKALEKGQQDELSSGKDVTYKGKQMSYYEVVTTIKGEITSNYQKVNGLVEAIRKLHDNGADKYANHGQFNEITKLYNTAEQDELLQYVENLADYEEMLKNYTAADAAVQAWIDAVNKLKAEGKVDGELLRITYDNKDDVVAAQTAFSDGLKKHDNIVFDDIITVISGLKSADGEFVAGSYKTYTDSTKINSKLAELEEARDTFRDAAKALSTDLIADDAQWATQYASWKTTYEHVEELYKALLTVGSEDEVEYKNNELYFVKAEADSDEETAWTTYQKAIALAKQYVVENDIRSIYGEEYTTDYKTHGFVYGDRAKIEAAREAYDEYIENGGQQADIRNYDRLTYAEAEIQKVLDHINELVIKVVKIFDKEYAGTTEDDLLLELSQLKLQMTIEKIYGLNIAYLGDSEYGVSYTDPYKVAGEDKTIRQQIQDLKDEGKGAGDYETVKRCEELLTFVQQEWTKQLTSLNADIESLITKDDDPGLEPADLTKIQQIVDTYAKLDKSQQTKINRWTEFEALSDKQTSVDIFNKLADELIKDTNYTALTKYYIEVVKSIYNSLGSSYRALYKPAYDRVVKYEETYDQYVADNPGVVLPSVKGLSDQLKQLQEAVTALEGTVDGLDGLESKITGAYQQAIAAAKAELQKAIDDLSKEGGAIKVNADEIAKLKQALEDLDNTYATDAELAALESKITEAYKAAIKDAIDNLSKPGGAIKANADEIAKLQQALKDLDKTYATDAELQSKLDSLKAEVETAYKKAVDDAKTELQGKIDALKNGAVTTNSNKIAELEQALKDLDKTYATDAELAALESKITEAYKAAIKDAIDNLSKEGGAIKANADEIAKLQQALKDLDKTYATDAELQSKLDSLKAEVETAYKKAVDDAKTELQGKIDALKNGDVKANADDIDKLEQELAALKTSTGADKADLEAKIAALESKITAAYNQALENAKTELQGQIDTLKGDVDTLKGNVSALMVVLIIVGVIAVALVVCVILLFIKRKAD